MSYAWFFASFLTKLWTLPKRCHIKYCTKGRATECHEDRILKGWLPFGCLCNWNESQIFVFLGAKPCWVSFNLLGCWKLYRWMPQTHCMLHCRFVAVCIFAAQSGVQDGRICTNMPQSRWTLTWQARAVSADGFPLQASLRSLAVQIWFNYLRVYPVYFNTEYQEMSYHVSWSNRKRSSWTPNPRIATQLENHAHLSRTT